MAQKLIGYAVDDMNGHERITSYKGIEILPLRYRLNGGSLEEHACHGYVFHSHSNVQLKGYYCFENMPYNQLEVEQWIQLMNDCGFKCSINFKKCELSLNNYGSKGDKKTYDVYITIDIKDYINNLHWKVGITAIRMFCYQITQGVFGVAQQAIRLYKTSGYEDAYFTLTSCFVGKKITGDTASHNLTSSTKCSPLTREEFEKRINSGHYTSVNAVSVKY